MSDLAGPVTADALAEMAPVDALVYGYVRARLSPGIPKFHLGSERGGLLNIVPPGIDLAGCFKRLTDLNLLEYHVTSFEGNYYTLP